MRTVTNRNRLNKLLRLRARRRPSFFSIDGGGPHLNRCPQQGCFYHDGGPGECLTLKRFKQSFPNQFAAFANLLSQGLEEEIDFSEFEG